MEPTNEIDSGIQTPRLGLDFFLAKKTAMAAQQLLEHFKCPISLV